ncbi:alpha-D-ribose 1-methylphosphonate 5-triphosphate diphosphatase [Magnetospirillum sp. 64-120]|uniref:alpha-D-ribose 1-methylphosphonate 5-triphosphate diphosphatase n=1 Tax=Magnetospirillum sp. 64-120 TaxID=1895778 RepID=UPI00092592EC|nr:alpha-D-ribose 1-methylphosphonate 5-triphosphate diphosphatase [Magnetospirillum sp. 64-120]OJX65811.1 MAG: alpha-D-ribose 1-methylphosphonate 5-triphosphate diphosphatase [Magnetospirillum sp. 64-120]
MRIRIQGAHILTPQGELLDSPVTIDDGTILAMGEDQGGKALDARGLLLLPGIIDLHGDAFERQLMPRPQVHFPTDVALVDTDRQMLANGITTALHGLTWSWEPGLRGREAALSFLDNLERLRPSLGCDSRVHLRHEVYNIDAADEIEEWLGLGRLHLLAFNDHLPMFLRRVEQPTKLAQYAERAHMSLEDFVALVHRVADRQPLVDTTNRRLAKAARQHGVALASHDDESPEIRQHFHQMGCSLCEFPLTRPTAETARQMGDGVIMGAPNVVRGGSHIEGGMRAADMAAAGLVDVLTSDYYYPALVHAPFRLVRDGQLPLARAWGLVSANPARLAGFTDRGQIAPGQRADLVLVDASTPTLPRVVATMVSGRVVHATRDLWA